MLISILSLSLLANGVVSAEPAGISIVAHFLDRAELPDDFRFPLMELNFRVLRVTLQNDSTAVWEVPSSIEIWDVKNKSVKVVSPTDMTPKIVQSKLFLARQRTRDTGPLETVPIYPNPATYRRYPQGRAAGPAMVSAGAAQQVRETLESHQLTTRELQPGEQLAALIYVKSKKKLSDLNGGRLLLGDIEIRTQ